ncbi:hypothetical protein [Burkholderia sp. SRS-W-2-2016]|nr:hypothetical protein [Burkholderia sp. SRS-W-2-2016]
MRKRDVVVASLRSPFSAQARELPGGRELTLGMLEKAMQRGAWQRD